MAVIRLPVTAVDVTTGTVKVTLPSGDSAFVPAPAGYYLTDAWVVMDGSQPLYALGPVAVGKGYRGGTITGVTGGNAAVQMSDGSGTFTIPMIAGSYAANDTVWVATDAWGRPAMGAEWLASSGNDSASAGANGGDSTEAPPTQVVASRAQFGASSIGTYRVSKGNWNSWNVGRFGWPANAYQGSSYGSGTLIGVIGFGDQIVALGASSITGAVLTISRSDGNGGAVAPSVVGIADGAAGGGAPSGLTAVYTGAAVGGGGGSAIGLGSDILSGFQSGAIKGLAMVGSYSAWVGATLTLDITRNV